MLRTWAATVKGLICRRSEICFFTRRSARRLRISNSRLVMRCPSSAVGCVLRSVSAEMKWFSGTYPQRFNARHWMRGYLFVEEEVPLCLYPFEGVSSPGSNVGQGALRYRSFVL